MDTFFIKTEDTKTPNIPDLKIAEDLTKNAIISPEGDFYGMDGSYHELTARYIFIMVLGLHPNLIKKGTFFKESYEGHLRKNGWIIIKDVSWITDSAKTLKHQQPKIFGEENATKRQIDRLFDYDEKFGTKFSKLVDNH